MDQVWAVARTVLMEFFRMRVLMALLLLVILSYTAGLAYWLYAGSGQADEKVQTFLSYGLSLACAAQSLLTIFFSASTVSREVRRKEIFLVTTKPIRRGEYLAGKFAGLAVLNLMLLILHGGLIYGLAKGIGHYSEKSPMEAARLQELVFIARESVKPPDPDVAEEVRQQVEKIVEEKKKEEPLYVRNPQQLEAMRNTLTRELEKQAIARRGWVTPGQALTFHFSGVKPIDREKGLIFIRYEQDVSVSPDGSQLYGQWAFGPVDPLAQGGERVDTRDVIRTIHEFPIPASAVSPDGDLYVTYRNPLENRPVTVIFPVGKGIEVLYTVGGFEANFLRTLLMIYFRLLYLSVLGLALGAWLSFPVAGLSILVVFLMGSLSGFISDAMQWEAGKSQQTITYWILFFMPHFSVYDAVSYLEKGRVVTWLFVSQCWITMVLISGGIAGLIGYLIFKFRELARVIV